MVDRRTRGIRKYARGGAVAEAPLVAKVSIETNSSPKKVAADVFKQHEEDSASNAFQQQIAALRNAEGMAHQRHRAEQFLAHNPDMKRFHGDLNGAEDDAIAAGHKPDTDEYYAHVKQAFENRRFAAVAAEKPPEEAPKPEWDIAPENAHRDVHIEMHDSDDYEEPDGRNVSAPVSREVPTGSYTSKPGTVRLTPEQKSHARAAGISELEYAKGVLKLRERKANGDYQ